MDAREEETEQRFEALVGEVVEPLRRYLARRTDPATAEDVVAESLLVCWRRLDEVPQEPLPWAYAVARRCLANAERAARRQRRVAGRVAAVDPPRDRDDPPGPRDDVVHEALAALPAADAEVLRLSAWEQLGASEIAAVLGVSPNAVSVRLHRARRRLADEVRKIEASAGHEQAKGGGR